MDKAEKNWKLAEWIEVQHQYDPCEIRTGRTPTYCKLCHIAKQYGADAVQLPCRPDFYLSEEASALLLEKMPEVILCRRLNPKDGQWYCQYYAGDVRVVDGVLHPDRKTAIAEAALRLMESEKGEK